MIMNELNLFLFITNLSVCALMGVLMPILPLITRKSFLFGVKVPAEVQTTSEAKNLKKNYMTICLIGTAVMLALVIVQYIAVPDMTLLAVMYFPLLLAAVQLLAYIPNWKKALRLKEERKWVVSDSVFADTKTSHTRGNLSELPWVWYILSLILIIVSVVVALIEYPNLPDRIPTHWNADMVADAWSDKSYMALLLMPLIDFGTLVTMWLCAFMFVRAKLQIDPQNPALSFTQHKIYRRRMGHSLGFLTLAIVAVFVFLGFKSIWPELYFPFGFMMALIILPTLPVIIVPVVSGQGGGKIKPKTIPSEIVGNPGMRTDSANLQNRHGRGDDKRWALGMFYHNPDDPAYIIEDRFGSNLGFNYSRLPVKIGVVLGMLSIVAFYVWFTVWVL